MKNNIRIPSTRLTLALTLALGLLFTLPGKAEEHRDASYLPGGLLAATYLGGSGTDGGWPQNAMARDPMGNLYVVGYTLSEDFPTTPGAISETRQGAYDVFIAKFNPDLSSLLASTYLGGLSSDRAVCMAFDNTGNIYLAGDTHSDDFPVSADAYMTDRAGVRDLFVAKLDSQLTTVLRATYLGGTGQEDRVLSLQLDETGDVFLTGLSKSPDYPTTPGAYNENINDPSAPYTNDIVISRLNSELTELRASTYLGGSAGEIQSVMALAGPTNLYVVGTTESNNFPTTPGAYSEVHQGSLDISISRLDRDLTTLQASTLLGGTDWDFAYSLAIDPVTGDLFVGGHGSHDYPTTPGAYETTYHGGPEESADITLSKLNSDLTELLASTFIGGSGYENGLSLELDSKGNVCLGGYTSSADYPTTPGAFDETPNGNYDAFVSLFSNDLSVLILSTVLGGSVKDREVQALLAGDGVAYLSVNARSQDMPMTGQAFQDTYQGATDLYLAKIILTSLSADETFIPADSGGTVQFSLDAQTMNAGRDYLLLGSLSGASPGYPLPGGLSTLPINWDSFTDRLLYWIHQPALVDFLGSLDSEGRGKASMTIGILRPKTVGLRLTFSFCLAEPFDFVANPVWIEIL